MSYQDGLDELAGGETLPPIEPLSSPSYDEGMELIADAVVEVLGVEAADMLGPLAAFLSAGGEVAKGAAAAAAVKKAEEAEKAQTVNAGEIAFRQMKIAAEAAKWPGDLKSQIIYLDKSWQATKATGNLEAIKMLTEQMRTMAAQLQARMGVPGALAMPPGTTAAYPPPSAPWPLWLKVVSGLAGAGLVGLIGYRVIKR